MKLQPIKQAVVREVTRANPSSTYSIAGNGYQAGQCVWYIKNLRPDIPNNWHSAYQWLGNAQAVGWPTGSTPRINSIGVAGNHVVLIKDIIGNKVVTTEMNQKFIPYQITSRTLPSNYFHYIY